MISQNTQNSDHRNWKRRTLFWALNWQNMEKKRQPNYNILQDRQYLREPEREKLGKYIAIPSHHLTCMLSSSTFFSWAQLSRTRVWISSLLTLKRHFAGIEIQFRDSIWNCAFPQRNPAGNFHFWHQKVLGFNELQSNKNGNSNSPNEKSAYVERFLYTKKKRLFNQKAVNKAKIFQDDMEAKFQHNEFQYCKKSNSRCKLHKLRNRNSTVNSKLLNCLSHT